jgi:hypothetical protein
MLAPSASNKPSYSCRKSFQLHSDGTRNDRSELYVLGFLLLPVTCLIEY